MKLKIAILLTLLSTAIFITMGGGYGCGNPVQEFLDQLSSNIDCGNGISADGTALTLENFDAGDITDKDVVCCCYRSWASEASEWTELDKTDSDFDGAMDLCDPDENNPDYDGDGIADGVDNCPLTPNPEQEMSLDENESDYATLGDACRQ